MSCAICSRRHPEWWLALECDLAHEVSGRSRDTRATQPLRRRPQDRSTTAKTAVASETRSLVTATDWTDVSTSEMATHQPHDRRAMPATTVTDCPRPTASTGLAAKSLCSRAER